MIRDIRAVSHGIGFAALVALGACADGGRETILKTQAQRCDKHLSVVIDPDVFAGLDQQGVRGRAIILASRIHMEPSRREAIGDNVRLIVTKSSCQAYDQTGNALGEYTMVLSTDKLSWWVRTDDNGEIRLTKMVQKFDKKGAPLKVKKALRLALKNDKRNIEVTRFVRSREEKTRTFASYEYIPKSLTLKVKTHSRILEFEDDGRLTQSFYCYELEGPNCQDPTKWDAHRFHYNDSGLVIGESGVSEGIKYHHKRDFVLNGFSDVINESVIGIEDEDHIWKQENERRILYYD